MLAALAAAAAAALLWLRWNNTNDCGRSDDDRRWSGQIGIRPRSKQHDLTSRPDHIARRRGHIISNAMTFSRPYHPVSFQCDRLHLEVENEKECHEHHGTLA